MKGKDSRNVEFRQLRDERGRGQRSREQAHELKNPCTRAGDKLSVGKACETSIVLEPETEAQPIVLEESEGERTLFLLTQPGLGQGRADLFEEFLRGLCAPLDHVAFFLYDDAVSLLKDEDLASTRELLASLAEGEQGLTVFACAEDVDFETPEWVCPCPISDLPLLIETADKVVRL